jgi:predicted RNA-binding protein
VGKWFETAAKILIDGFILEKEVIRMENKGPLLNIEDIMKSNKEFVKGAERIEVFTHGAIVKSLLGIPTTEEIEVEAPKMKQIFPNITVIIVDREKTMIISGELNYVPEYFWTVTLNRRDTVDFLLELERFKAAK